jgi:hypothetical protein
VKAVKYKLESEELNRYGWQLFYKKLKGEIEYGSTI